MLFLHAVFLLDSNSAVFTSLQYINAAMKQSASFASRWMLWGVLLKKMQVLLPGIKCMQSCRIDPCPAETSSLYFALQKSLFLLLLVFRMHAMKFHTFKPTWTVWAGQLHLNLKENIHSETSA